MPQIDRVAQKQSKITNDLLAHAPGLRDVGHLISFVAESLLLAEVPLFRTSSHVRTLHPEFLAVMRVWRRDVGMVQEFRPTRPSVGPNYTDAYYGSPFEYVQQARTSLDVHLDERAFQRFPMMRELRAEGVTHYVMIPLVFADGTVNALSFGSDTETGFSIEDVRLFEALIPVLQVTFEAKALRRIYAELLASYVGKQPADQILQGTVRKGDVHELTAAILVADMRKFTGLSDTLAPGEVARFLNLFFELSVPPVTQHGGEVLKFMGDGFLAIFHPEGTSAAVGKSELAGLALSAARTILKVLEDRRLARPDGGIVRAGIALHLGKVAYGNIGGGGRSDFTIIGRDVNLVSRIQSLCDPVGEPLLLSADFAEAVSRNRGVREVGSFDLKGFSQASRIFIPNERT